VISVIFLDGRTFLILFFVGRIVAIVRVWGSDRRRDLYKGVGVGVLRMGAATALTLRQDAN